MTMGQWLSLMQLRLVSLWDYYWRGREDGAITGVSVHVLMAARWCSDSPRRVRRRRLLVTLLLMTDTPRSLDRRL